MKNDLIKPPSETSKQCADLTIERILRQLEEESAHRWSAGRCRDRDHFNADGRIMHLPRLHYEEVD